MLLIVVDSYSKWLEVHTIPSITSARTIEKLRPIFATHGLPKTIVSDNGLSLVSSEFKKFLQLNGICHITSAPYHPSTNGLAEGCADCETGSQTDGRRFSGREAFTVSPQV